MISGWNRFIYRNNVSNRMNMNINTGGTVVIRRTPLFIHALIVTNIRGYVYPVIYNVFFRQHRRMLYFFACLYKDAAVYDCWRWRGIPMKRQAVCAVCGQEFIADRVTQKYCSSYCRRYAHRHGASSSVRLTASACTGSTPRKSAPSSSGGPSNAATAEPWWKSRSRRINGRPSAVRPAGKNGFPCIEIKTHYM